MRVIGQRGGGVGRISHAREMALAVIAESGDVVQRISHGSHLIKCWFVGECRHLIGWIGNGQHIPIAVIRELSGSTQRVRYLVHDIGAIGAIDDRGLTQGICLL